MSKKYIKSGIIAVSIISIISSENNVFAQNQDLTTLDGKTGIVSTAVPFLRISPDARSGAMGDIGLAISPDANAQYWNVAKLAMSDQKAGVSVTYTPWLRDLVPDVFMAYIAGYYKFGENDNQAISASLRYFSLGTLDYRDELNYEMGTGKPTEMAFDVGYSRKLSENLSIGTNLRYIYSNIAAGSTDPSMNYSAASAFSADVGVFYTKTKSLGNDKASTISAGAVLSNLGSKISYTQTVKDFIPTTLGIGAAYTYQMDMYNKVTFGLDLNKATTPAPIKKKISDTTWTWDRQNELGVVQGFFKSFAQAPAGYGTTVSIGGEYWYQDQFAGRAGYFYEAEGNGGRQYFTIGVGARYNMLGIDVSYLVPSGSSTARNPLSNTLRFSLLFDFNKEAMEKAKRKKEKKERAEEKARELNAPTIQKAN